MKQLATGVGRLLSTCLVAGGFALALGLVGLAVRLAAGALD